MTLRGHLIRRLYKTMMMISTSCKINDPKAETKTKILQNEDDDDFNFHFMNYHQFRAMPQVKILQNEYLNKLMRRTETFPNEDERGQNQREREVFYK